MLLKALKNEGVNAEKDLTLVSQAPEVGGSNLKTNQIAAHANFVPFGELFAYRGFARKIFDGAQTGTPTFHGVLVRSPCRFDGTGCTNEEKQTAKVERHKRMVATEQLCSALCPASSS